MIARRRGAEGAQCVCAPFCQHPSCWKADNRKQSGRNLEPKASSDVVLESIFQTGSTSSIDAGSQKHTARTSSSYSTDHESTDHLVLPALPTVTVSTLDFGFLDTLAKPSEQQTDSQARKVPYNSMMIDRLQRQHEKDSGHSTMRTNTSVTSSSKVSIVGFQATSKDGADTDASPGKYYVWVPGKTAKTTVPDVKKDLAASRSPAIRNLNDDVNLQLPSPQIIAPENTFANATEYSSNPQSKFPSRMTGSMRRSQMTDHYALSRLQAPIEFPEGKPLSMKEVYELWDPVNLEKPDKNEPAVDGSAQRMPVPAVTLSFEPSKAGKSPAQSNVVSVTQPATLSGQLQLLDADKDKNSISRCVLAPPTSPVKHTGSKTLETPGLSVQESLARRRTVERVAQRRLHYISLDLPGNKPPSFAVALSANALVNLPRSTQQSVAFRPCGTPTRTASVASSERMTDADSLSTIVTCNSARSTLDQFFSEEDALEQRRRQYFESRGLPDPGAAGATDVTVHAPHADAIYQPAPPPTSPSPENSLVEDERTSETPTQEALDEGQVEEQGDLMADQTFVTNWATSLLDIITEDSNPSRLSYRPASDVNESSIID